jgi:hypothetical protein
MATVEKLADAMRHTIGAKLVRALVRRLARRETS